jgi:hypothetical protein
MVHADDWSVGAGSETGVEPEANVAVFGGAFFVDAEGFHDLTNDWHDALDVAGGTPADLYPVTAWRVELEVSIEGRDAPNVVDGGAGDAGHFFGGFRRDVSQLVLYRQKAG